MKVKIPVDQKKDTVAILRSNFEQARGIKAQEWSGNVINAKASPVRHAFQDNSLKKGLELEEGRLRQSVSKSPTRKFPPKKVT
jgi:hypothetical protein